VAAAYQIKIKQKLGNVEQAHEYIYSSAKIFAGQLALLEIDEIQ
jgi:hypothetical protein